MRNGLMSASSSRELVHGSRPRIIAVDGSPGSGKTELCTQIAERLGYKTITTGMVFCSLAAVAREALVSGKDPQAMSLLIAEARIDFDPYSPSDLLASVNGKDLTGQIFTEANKRSAADVSQYVEAREKAAIIFSNLSRQGEWVFDRDPQNITEKIDLRIWLDASREVRAARRCAQLALEGNWVPYGEICENMTTRESKDSLNPANSLTRQSSQIVIDTSNLGIEQVFTEATRYLMH